MSELVLIAALFVGLVVLALFASVAAVATVTVALVRATGVVGFFPGDPPAGHRSLDEVEARLRTLELERYIDAGVVCDVVPERRRSAGELFARRGPAVDGVRVDVAVPTAERTVTDVWFPIPERLTGQSALERFLNRHRVPYDDLTELVGTELPVRKTATGEWRVVLDDGRPRGSDAGELFRRNVRWLLENRR
ncbi:hypothetical protein [Halegenticoccus soli]|uniref:hypothetical protein n=1 Tax=Halegenticoccus soli TaxID=1985678 RepID=UPI000C6DDDAB|nr:hypothetical protein [Halegenticoccus soli]